MGFHQSGLDRTGRRSFLAMAAGATAGACLLRRSTSYRAGERIDAATGSTLRSSGGRLQVDLVARQTAVDIPGGPARALTYNGLLPGPRLEAQPGDGVRIRLINRLDRPTNLHYHGLHIPPGGNADNVFLSVAPGATQTHDFTIPADHPAGTFYYHPHRHGTVADQVFGGLGGVLIVRGALDRIPEVQAATEQVLFLKDLAGEGGVTPAGPGMGMGMMLGREGSVLTVNGRVNPELTVPAGGLLRLRIVNASNARFWRLALEDHPFHLIATDGGALEAPVAMGELLLAPGERADLLVRGDRRPGSYRLLNLPYARVAGAMMGGMGRMGGRRSGPGMGFGPRAGMGMAPGMGMVFLINGRPYQHHRVDTRVQVGETEEWDLVNDGVMDHPFHVHINPFQVISRNGVAEPYRAWKDVVLVRAGGTVYHCHILDPEELGMMGVLEIT